MAKLERIGLERGDLYATAICRAAGANVDEELFRYFPPRTVEEELAALEGLG